MRRYLEPSTSTPSGRYGLTLTEPTEPTEPTEVPLTPEQCWALASYQRPTSRVHCCPAPAPIAPSDATEWVW